MVISNRAIKILSFVLLFICNAQASEFWTLSKPNSRHYLSTENSNTKILLKHFFQHKGEYQSLVDSYSFQSKTEMNKFISTRFPSYLRTTRIDLWPIKKIRETGLDKGLFGGPKNQYIWLSKNQWNDDWEIKYGNWLQNEVTPDFFKRYKISTDCADALIGLRWIFARINSLPVANTLVDTGSLFGHFSMRKEWIKYNTATNWYEDQLFLAALDYVMNLTSSRTVMNDGFPVKIDKTGLVPGDFIITQNKSSGHAKIITETHYEEITELPLYTLASTSPRAIRILNRELFMDQDWPSIGDKEILAFRWPVIVNSNWVLQPRDVRPTYSLEQFDLKNRKDFPAFIQFLLSRVKGNYDPLKLVEMGLNDIIGYANQRIKIVSDGYEFCKKNDCRTGTDGDEDWGTANRDAKLLKKFQDIDILVNQFENLSPGLFDRWVEGMKSTTMNIEGVTLSLYSLRFILENNLYSSHASDTPMNRWGINSQDLLTKLFSSVEKLLHDRNDVINRIENRCGQDCHPKTNMWVGLSTYHLDADLNLLFTQINTYCILIDIKGCQNFFTSSVQKDLIFNGEAKTLEKWFRIIPFFNSDPRANIDRRWGRIPSDISVRTLPYFDSIKISKNSWAVLDSRKLINLTDGKILFQASEDSRIFLTKIGVVYKINDVLGEIKRLVLNGETISWITIKDPDKLLSLEKERLLFVEEDNGHTIFRKSHSQGVITFRINNDKIEFIKEHTGATHQKGSLVTMALNKSTMSFIDLDRTLNIDLTVAQNKTFFDMNLIQISSYKYPNAVLTYTDRDHDLYYSILVDLENKSWTRLAPSINEKSIVLWSDASLKKAILQTKYNQEFPELYAVSWDDLGQFKVQKLTNLLLGTRISGDTVYFIEASGGSWDQNLETKLYQWDITLLEVNSPMNTQVKFLTPFGAYFSSDDVGILRTFAGRLDYKLPKNLLPENEFCQIQTQSDDEIFTYRFNLSYGDFSCMGGSLLKSQITGSIDEIVPQFTNYAWINKNNLLDQRWQKAFAEFDVQNGVLIGVGKNIGYWWAPK
ncbi:MAG: hypothetical protein H7281_06300 [Bacteriovorax sp.]|nr:hypothetical protein [Bacteriovorax sp.]